MKKVLIIGGAGFVGRNLVDLLVSDKESQIYILDNFLSSDRETVLVSDQVFIHEGDAGHLSSFNEIPKSISEIYILNCLHGNQSSLHNPVLDLENTLKPIISTLEWVRANSIQAKIVYAGAGCAVAEKTWTESTPVVEIDLIDLEHDSPYSISKLAGEMHCQMYWKQFGLQVVRARFQNIYGPGEVLGAGKWRGTDATIWRNVTPTFIWKALHGQDLTITGKNASRDFIYVEDLCRGLQLLMKNGKSGEAYNLASGEETSIYDWAQLILNICNSSSKIDIKSARAWDNSGRRVGSVEKSKTQLGFIAETPPEEGLVKTIDWTKKNSNWIEQKISIHAGHK